VSFYDLAGDVDALLQPIKGDIQRVACTDQPGMHPGATAALMLGDVRIGWLGELHPALVRHYDLTAPVFVAEMDIDALDAHGMRLPVYHKVTKFPGMRRDVALIVSKDTPCEDLRRRSYEPYGSPLMAETAARYTFD